MFTTDSLHIMRLISNKKSHKKSHKKIQKKHYNTVNNDKLILKYDDLLESIEDDLRPLFTMLKNTEKYNHTINSKEKTIHQELNKYIAKNIVEYINTKIKYRQDYVVKINNKTINLSINSEIQFTDSNMKVFLNKLIYAIGIVTNLSSDDKTINLVIYLTPHKKTCDEFKQREYITVEEINSGSTKCCDKPYVIVCRIEELFKVVIHELIHALDFDVKNDDINVCKKIKDVMNIDTPYNMFEAYTEIWANILNAYFIANVMINNKSLEETFQLFIELIKIEQRWSFFQAAKIMILTNAKIEPHIHYNKLINLNKNTNVLAYFILRSFIFFEFNDFIRNCRDNNINYINLNGNMDFFSNIMLNLTLQTIYNKEYILLIKRNKRVLKYLKYLNNHRKNKKLKNNILLLTLRMSACELNII